MSSNGITEGPEAPKPEGWLAEEIRTRRRSADLTQAQLADQLSVTQATVSEWERGRSSPRGRRVKRLEEILGVGLRPAEPLDVPYCIYPAFAEFVVGCPALLADVSDDLLHEMAAWRFGQDQPTVWTYVWLIRVFRSMEPKP